MIPTGKSILGDNLREKQLAFVWSLSWAHPEAPIPWATKSEGEETSYPEVTNLYSCTSAMQSL